MKKISVIIPVYNAERYIEQCVQSLLGQTYQNWEALLLDDGSTDRSLELYGALSRTDGRIKVYHQENKGISAARNCGLDLAGGAYVTFLDSDDAVHPLLFEEMMRQVEEHHVEMAFCNCAQVEDRQMDAALAGASPQDERPRWQIGDGAESEGRLITVGSLIRRKGIDYLAQAARRVLKQFPDWKWLVVGSGEEQAFLEGFIRENRLEGRLAGILRDWNRVRMGSISRHYVPDLLNSFSLLERPVPPVRWRILPAC